YPEKGRLPTSSEHPNSIFTLLGRSHRMNVSEEATTVCPRDICRDERLDESFLSRLGAMAEDVGLVYAHVVAPPELASGLPSVSETWGDFGGGEGAEEVHDEAIAVDDDGEIESAAEGKKATLANLKSDRGAKFDEWIERIPGGRRPT